MPTPASHVALDIRRATPDDLPAVVDVLHQAYDWLIARGITDQWTAPFDPDTIAPLIDRGEVFIATHDGQPVATFTLTYTPDPELWGNPPDDAGYIRRLAVDRAYSGHELGGQLLNYAGELVAAAGRPWLRLDCAKQNEHLHAYYAAQGFTHVTTVDLPHRQSGALFERPAMPRSEGQDPPSTLEGLDPHLILDHDQRSTLLRAGLAQLLRIERYGALCSHEPVPEDGKGATQVGFLAWFLYAWTTTALAAQHLEPSGAGWIVLIAVTSVAVLVVFRLAMSTPIVVAFITLAWPISALVFVIAGAPGSTLWWTYWAPVALAAFPWLLRSLRLGTARDLTSNAAMVVRSAPLLGPVALVVLFVPLFSAELWEVARGLRSTDWVALYAVTVGVMSVLVAFTLYREIDAVVRASAQRLERAPDPLALLVAEVRRVQKDNAEVIEQLARDTVVDAFAEQRPREYAPYIAATVRRGLGLSLLPRLLICVTAATLILSVYFYALSAVLFERSQIEAWIRNPVPVEIVSALGMHITLPTGVYLQVAALLGIAATAVYLSMVLTEDRFSQAIADALLHRPTDRCLALAIPYVWLDERAIEQQADAQR